MRKITFPHMGPYVHAFDWFMRNMGWEVVLPQPYSPEILSRGVQYAPEFFCLPFKICLGSMADALDRGAEVVVTSGGVGPCRAGHYHMLEEEVLKRQGYQFEMIVLETIKRYPFHFVDCVHRLNAAHHSIPAAVDLIKRGFRKIAIIDELDEERRKRRPRELKKGASEVAYDEALKVLDAADSWKEIEAAAQAGRDLMDAVKCDWERPVLQVSVAGEIFLLLDPASNLEIEKMLGELGVQVHRHMTLNNWLGENAVSGGGAKTPAQAARPYLDFPVGGHGQETVGHAVLAGEQGYDGFVQMAPFTCIPEIVARGVLPDVSRDYDLPVLTFFLDEQTGEAGMRTRVEAFVDMLWPKRQLKEETVQCSEAM